MLSALKKYEFMLFSLLYWLACIFILYFFNGTGNEADSVHHYLFARYSFEHPELFLDHWAKPLFTLVSSPFAQFGFMGAKVFNCICAFLASIFTYKIVKELNFKFAILAPLFYFIFPLSFITTFSGLTEPLCAFVLSLSIYLFQKKRLLACSILLSFTPFIRSEGLFFIGVFALFFLYNKSWKALFLLSLGHIIYSVIGYFHYEDLLWVFSEIPYAHLSSHYGGGGLLHFAEKLNYMMGIPLLVFFILGILRFFVGLKSNQQALNLIALLFLTFFIAHSLFWYLEVFNSMGLKRVFAAITPLMAILCLYGFNLLSKFNNKLLKTTAVSICLLATLLFPFTSNPAAVDWEDLNLTEAQQNAVEVCNFIRSESIPFNRLVYTDSYLCELLQVDPYDASVSSILASKKVKIPLSELIQIINYQFQYVPQASSSRKVISPEAEKGDLIIWDNWHSVVDYDVQEGDLSNYRLIATFEKGNSVYKVYRNQHE